MKYIYITTAILVILTLLATLNGIPQVVDMGSLRVRSEEISTGEIHSRETEFTRSALAENKDAASKTSTPAVPIVAKYEEGDQAWMFFAKVMQLQDVSIYGKPGTIARIEYMRDGEPTSGWTVIQIDDYYFGDGAEAIGEGQEILLEVSGEHVSSQGVNWDACPYTDEYCQYASFIEGGFPMSEDYNGLTVCPSNMLIYSGYASNDWINGMLAWKIKTVPAKADQDCIHCPSGIQPDYFP